LKLLGKVITGEGIIPDPALLQDIRNFPPPKNAKQIMRFLGLTGVYQNFISNYQTIAEPLHALTRKSIEWKWGEAELKSFTALIQAMMSENVLHHPDFSRDFIILSDASSIGAGAVLTQEHNGQLFPVSYASWLFTPTQQRYSTTERELLALVLSVRKWKTFFLDRKFRAKTDHKAIMKLHDPYGRIARWHAELAQFNFKIEYIPGKMNSIADTLSRSELDVASVLAELGTLKMYEIVAGVDILSLPSDNLWAKMQREDPDWYPIIRWIEKGDLPDDDTLAKQILTDAPHYSLWGDQSILVRRSKLKEGDPIQTLRKVVPSCWKRLMLTQFHDSMFKGTHAGRDKTYFNLSSAYYFKDMAKYVDYFVKSCHICQRVKDPSFAITPWTPLGTIEAKCPWDLVSIDLWSPGVRSRSGNRYVLTIIDGFSKFATIHSIPNKEATTVALALFQTFSTLGYPARLHSDLGPEFINEVIQAFCEKFGIEKSNTTAYHPQGNAYAERIHKFFRQAISSYYLDDHRNWDEMLPPLIQAYNDSYHSALGVTPSEVFLGRRLGTPPLTSKSPEGDYTQLGFVAKLDYILAKTHALVFAKIQSKMESNQVRSLSQSKNRLPTVYTVGQEVLLYRPIVSEDSSYKLTPHWFGPYVIDKVGRHNKVYYLKDPLGVPLKLPVSVWRLKEYTSRDENMSSFEKFPDEVIRHAETSREEVTSAPEVTEHSQESQNFNLEWNDPEEEFVPLRDNIMSRDKEEQEVLKSLQSETLLKSRHLSRPTKAPVKLSLPSSRKTASAVKKRKIRIYY
jgi:transposase InsO family protein